MRSTKFEGTNAVYGQFQPEYVPLPAYRDENGRVTTCWKFGWKERLGILIGWKLFWTQATFNEPLQPVKPQILRKFPMFHDPRHRKESADD